MPVGVGVSFTTPEVGRSTLLSCSSSFLVRGMMVDLDEGSGKWFGYFEIVMVVVVVLDGGASRLFA